MKTATCLLCFLPLSCFQQLLPSQGFTSIEATGAQNRQFETLLMMSSRLREVEDHQTSDSSVCILESPSFTNEVSKIAARLKVPLVSTADQVYTHALVLQPYERPGVETYSLGISSIVEPRANRRKHSKKTKIQMSLPFSVDFVPDTSTRLGKRFARESGTDLLSKAVSPRRGYPSGAFVCDLTSGWCQDSLLIASTGARKVLMVERDEIVATLVDDAFRRLHLLAGRSSDESVREVASNLAGVLSFVRGDGTTVAKRLVENNAENTRPDIMYLDPMFPERKKDAAVKKNMQILHGLLSAQGTSDQDRQENEALLLVAAFAAARDKVVVKRPVNDEPIGLHTDSFIRPSYSIDGTVNRWDIYVKSKADYR